MIERKVLINNKIIGILTLPEQNATVNRTAAVMLHGFASDKDESGCKNAYQLLAAHLAKNNIISLRIDFSGWGENKSIPQEQSTIETMISDAVVAFCHLKSLDGYSIAKIGFIGFSLGAAISILATRLLNGDSEFLALLSPVGNLPVDFETFLGKDTYKKLRLCEESIEISLPWTTIRLGKQFFNSLCRHDIYKELAGISVPCICIAGEDDFSAAHARSFQDRLKNKVNKLIIYENTDHCLNAFLDKPELLDAIENLANWVRDLN
jgi:pimeloyl-ACP methyl ester carboxylesterase